MNNCVSSSGGRWCTDASAHSVSKASTSAPPQRPEPECGMVTEVVDHIRDAHCMAHTRLLDFVPGRSGKAYADWLKERGAAFTADVKTAALDRFRGYANAIRDDLPEAVTVLDAFSRRHARVGRGRRVRRRVQQDTLGHRGRKGDPHQLQAQMLTRRRRPPTLPDQTNQPC